MKALIFDCDGVLVDTERDGHRVAFNKAFQQMGIPVEWDVDLYKQLLQVAGGKERMKYYFDQYGWPPQFEDKEKLIKDLHKLKTKLFMELIETKSLPLRPGVSRIIDEAIQANLKLAICSTSNKNAVEKIAEVLIGQERKDQFSAILAGDVVDRKKPAPDIYLMALEELKVEPEESVVVEDSRNGLLAAKAAGMHCIITTNFYTQDEDFYEADQVMPELGDGDNKKITVQELINTYS